MKNLLTVFGVFLTVITVIWDVIEFCAFPALCVVIGLLNSYPWQYYAFTVGGYIVLFIIAETVAYFIFKLLDKKYVPLIVRKIKKLFSQKSSDHCGKSE